MAELVSFLSEMEAPHPDFRVWITTEPHKDFPVSLLQMSIKYTYEPPQGIAVHFPSFIIPRIIARGAILYEEINGMARAVGSIAYDCRVRGARRSTGDVQRHESGDAGPVRRPAIRTSDLHRVLPPHRRPGETKVRSSGMEHPL